MALKSDVESLRDATITDLGAAHDHFIYTKRLWRALDVDIRRRGRRIEWSNEVRKSRVTEQDLLQIAQVSVSDHLPSATIQRFASLAETFLADLVRLWLMAYPMHLKGEINVQTVVAAPDKTAILRFLTDQYVLSMGYERPSAWFKRLNSIVSLHCPTDSEIEQFSEFKATRDAFIHNRGIVTETYLDKVGTRARRKLGQPLDLPDSYLHDSWRLCRKIVEDVGAAAAAKARAESESQSQ